jgi:serine/threonine protein kinase
MEGESARLGRVVGTMDYMAPEQIRTPDTVGPSADIYALGCTLYFVLTGEVPFPGGTRQEKAQRQLKDQPRPIRQLEPGVSEGFCRVVEAMMRKDAAERPMSAEAVVERLRQWTPATPLAMPRVRSSKASREVGATASEDASSRQSPPPLPFGSSLWQEQSQADQQSTRGLLSATEDTDRDGGVGTGKELWPVVPRPLAKGWRTTKFVARSVAVATVTAVAFTMLMRIVGGIDPDAADGLLGGGVLAALGWGAFGVMLVVQWIAAMGRPER